MTQIYSSLTADNEFNEYISTQASTLGTLIGQGNDWGTTYTNGDALIQGTTYYLHVVAGNLGGPEGLIGSFSLLGTGFQFADGATTLNTDGTDWSAAPATDATVWVAPVSGGVAIEGPNGDPTWGTRAGIASAADWIWSSPDNGVTAFFSTTITPISSNATGQAVSWIAPGSGDWSAGANWSGGATPGPLDTATLGGADTYTVTLAGPAAVGSVTLTEAGATLAVENLLVLAGTLGVGSGTLSLASGGTIDGGTIAAPVNGVGGSGGTLDGVSFEGTLNLSVDYSSLTLTGGTEFSGAGGAGAATINMTSEQVSTLNVLGTGSLNNATIDIGESNVYSGAVSAIVNEDVSGTGAVLTLGPDLTINQTSYKAALTSSDQAGDGIVNDGTILADFANLGPNGPGRGANGSFQIDATNFTNHGTIAASNDGLIILTGSVAASLVNSIGKSGGGLVQIAGTVTGGTIDAPDGGVGGAAGTLDGVSYEGTLDLSVDNSALTLTGGTTFSGMGGVGAATINLTGGGYQNSHLYVAGTETLDNATIDIGGYGTNYVVNQDSSGTGAILTFGPNLTINQDNNNAALTSSDKAGDGIVNDGTILADFANLGPNGPGRGSNGSFQIDATNFTNHGTIAASNNGLIILTGSVAASLVNSIGKSGGGLVQIAGTVTGGTIDAPDGGVGGAAGTLDGVSYEGTLDLSVDNSALTLTGGTTFSGVGGVGAATINLTGGGYQNSHLYVAGTETLDNATIDIGGYGTNYVVNQDSSGTGAILTFGPNLTINQDNNNAALTSSDKAGDGIVNDGTILADFANLGPNGPGRGSNGSFQIDATNFTNHGTIAASNNGLIILTGSVAASLVNSIGKSGGGLVQIAGTVTGGTIDAPDGGVGGAAGTLDGVSYEGTLDLSVDNSALTLTGGTTFSGVGGVGAATINLTGGGYQNSHLYVAGTEMLDNATIDIGGYGTNYVVNQDSSGTGAILTFGPNLTINQDNNSAALTSSDKAGDGIVNDGTILADFANLGPNGPGRGINGSFQIDATNFTNHGTIAASNDGLIILTGSVAASLVNSIGKSGGGLVQIAGTVTGGTIDAPDGGVGGAAGTLDGVSYEGTLDLSVDNSALTLTGGTTFSGVGGVGAATINLTGGGYQNSHLYVAGTEMLDNATIDIGGYGTNYVVNQDSSGTGAILTLGPNLTINQDNNSAALTSSDKAGDGIVNDGTILADFANLGPNGPGRGINGSFQIDATNFTNHGTIAASNDGLIILTGSVAASLVNSIGKSGGGLVQIAGTVTGGTIDAPDGGVGGAAGTLDGVSYEGTLDLSVDNSALTLTGGTTFSGVGGVGAATINLTGGGYQNSHLYVAGTETLDNATIDIGGYGTNYVVNQDSSGTGAILTLGPNLTINQDNNNAALTSSDKAGDGIVNDGTILADFATGTFTINPNSFTNNGTISASNGGTIDLTSTDFTNISGTTLTGGSYFVGAGSTIDLSNTPEIATLNADLTLSGSGSVFQTASTQIDPTLTAIGTGGALRLLNGRNLTTTNTLTDSGLLQLGGGTLTVGTLNILAGATLLGFGTIATTVADAGRIEANGGDLDLALGATGTVSLLIDAQATLELGASFSGPVQFAGANGTLKLDAPTDFTGTLTSMGFGDAIDFAGLIISQATLVGHSIVVTTSDGQSYSYAFDTLPSPRALIRTSDGSGGTLVTIGHGTPPVITAPASVTLGSGHATTISGISIAEIGSTTGETFTVTATDTNGLLSATVDDVVSPGTHTLTLTGSLAEVNAELATLTDTDSITPADNIALNATDSLGNQATTVTVAVAVNGPPVLVAPVAVTAGVNRPIAIAGVSLSETGAFAGETFTLTLTDSHGTLSAIGPGGPIFGSTSLTISGSLSDVNAALATLSDTDPVTPSDAISLTAADSLGNTAAETIAVTVNGLPVITAPASLTLGVGQPGTIGGVSLSETGNTVGETFTLTLTDSHGRLSTAGSHTPGTSLTLIGSLAQVNADLATLTDMDTTTPSDTITLLATDGFGNTGTATIAVTVNGLPVITAPGTATILQGTSTPISGVSLSESGNIAGETFTVTATDSHGTLSASGMSGTSVTLHGLLAQVNAELATLADTDASTVPDSITLTAIDGFGNSATAQTIAVTVAPLVPVLTAPPSVSVTQGVSTPISGVSLSETGSFAGEMFTVSITDNHGALSATGASGSATSLTLFGSLAQLNADLATLADTEPTGAPDVITLNATDSLGNIAATKTIPVTVSQHAPPVLAAPGSVTVGVGQPGTIGGISLSESGIVAGETFTVTLTDTNGQLSVTGPAVVINSGTSLSINGSLAQVNADLATLKDTDAVTPSDSITLTATDSLGNSATPVAIAVTVNGPPVIAAPATLTLGVGRSGTIGGVSLSETGNTSGESFTLTLTDRHGTLSAAGGGVPGTSITLIGSLAGLNAELATLADTDATTPSDTITLLATDGFGNTGTASIAVTVNGLPVITAPGTATVNQGASTLISGVSLSETGNIAGETFTVAIADSQGSLSASGSGVTVISSTSLTISGSLAQVNADLATLTDTDATTAPDSITLHATDGFGNSADDKTIALTVSQHAPPVVAAPGSVTLGVGQPKTIEGVSLSETDSFAGETFTVTIADIHGSLSAVGSGVSGSVSTGLIINGSLAQVNAALATLTDTDANTPSDTISLEATDGLGNTGTATIEVTVNGPPVITAPASVTLGVGQPGTIGGIALSESGNTVGETFTLTLADNNGVLSASGPNVTITGPTGLTITGSLAQVNAALATLSDSDATSPSDTITLNARDGFGNTGTATIAVTINEPPVIAAPAITTIVQGESTTLSGVSLSETGNIAGETFTVTLMDNDGALTAVGPGVSASASGTTLTITGSLGQVNADLATLADTDTRTVGDSITLTASDSFGNSAASRSLAVTVARGPADPTLITATPIDLDNVHVGDTAQATLSIINTAPAGAAALDASIGAVTGDATASGSFTGLAPGATDITDIEIGVNTATAGLHSGAAVLAYTSDTGSGSTSALPSQAVDVSGAVYREATAVIAPISEIVHVGDPGSIALTVENIDPADGYSEDLIAAIDAVRGDITAGGSGSTTDIAAGGSDSSLSLDFSTAQAAIISGTATVDLRSDGGIGPASIDGLGLTALDPQSVAVGVTVDNYALPEFELVSDGGTGATITTSGTSATLNLGTIGLETGPLTIGLGVLNAATGPADVLSGSFTTDGSSAFTVGNFGSFAGLDAGQADTAPTVTLDTSHAGTFTETITLDPSGSNASGYSQSIAPKTLTITGTVAAPPAGAPQPPPTRGPQGGAFPDPHLVTFDGLFYNFQTAGEFILARSTRGGTFEVQARLSAADRLSAGAAGSNYTVITEIAIQVGHDRVTIDSTRDSPVWVNGVAANFVNGVVTLADGTIQQNGSTYDVVLDTGESVVATLLGMGVTTGSVTTSAGISAVIHLNPSAPPNSVQGLLGDYNGDANQDLTLADGTVLPTDMPTSELYGAYADAWRVTQASSLLDYGAGDTTATYTDTNYPNTDLSITSFPEYLVAAATALVQQAGITDPGLQAEAIYDYLVTGDPDIVIVEANLQQQGVTTTTPGTFTLPLPPPEVGISAAETSETTAASGATTVVFTVYRAGDYSNSLTVSYDVVAPDGSYVGADDFGGTLPSGTVTFAAGQYSAQLSIALPNGVGNVISKTLAVQIAAPSPTVVIGQSAQTQIINSQSVAGTPPGFALELVNAGDILPTHVGDSWSFDLGLFEQSTITDFQTLVLAVVNTAAAGADFLDAFISAAGDGGIPTNISSSFSDLAPGAIFDVASVGVSTSQVGTHSETLTFTPYDSNVSGYVTRLPTQTVTISYTIYAAPTPVALPSPGTAQPPPPPNVPPGGGLFPDPHLITFDGLRYDFQTAGEFVLVRSTNGGTFQVQARLSAPSGATSYSVITELGIQVGSDRVTIDSTRAAPVYLNGVAANFVDGVLSLADGAVYQTASGYDVVLDTGEEVVANFATDGGIESGPVTTSGGISTSVYLSPSAEHGSVQGLLGDYNGDPSQDLTLADGTVLPTDMPSSEVYGAYADAWRVSQATSLLDYGAGQTTGTFTDENYPGTRLTIADFPTAQVNAATVLVQQAGITDPGLQQQAIYDYLITGDPTVVQVEANLQQEGITSAASATFVTPLPTLEFGISANNTTEVEAASGPTSVTFTLYRQGSDTSAVSVSYAVVTPHGSYLGAGAFGDTVPSGTVTFAAGQSTADVSIVIPDGIGSAVSKTLAVDISAASPAVVIAKSAQTQIVNSRPIAGPPAVFAVELTNDRAVRPTQSGDIWSFDLGALKQTALGNFTTLVLSAVNTASAGADDLDGAISASGDGGIPSGVSSSFTDLAPGAIFNIANLAVQTIAAGAHTETLTIASYDSNISGYAATLPTETVTFSDTIYSLATASLATVALDFGTIRAGTVASQSVGLENTGPAGAEALDASIGSTSGAAIGAGAVTLLGAGQSSEALSVGFSTSEGGINTGTVIVAFASDGTDVDGLGATALPSQSIAISGTVYFEAQPTLTLAAPLILHVGDTGAVPLIVSNAAGYVENLLADVTATSGDVSAPLGALDEIAAGGSASVPLTLSTIAAGTVSGSVTFAYSSDGSGTDDAALASIGTQTLAVNGTIDNYATADIEQLGGVGALTRSGADYTLNLGVLTEGGGAVTASLGVINAASGPADLLSGSFTTTGGTGFTNAGLAAFSGLAAGDADTAPSVTLSTAQVGTFSETITLDATGSNASGYSGALAPETLTVIGTVASAAAALTITGTQAAQATSDQAAIDPFANVTIAETGSVTETAQVTMSTTADGTLSHLGGGSYDTTTGVYTVSGSAADVTTALEGLVFTPTGFQSAPGVSVTTGFDLSVTSSSGATATDDTTSVVATAAAVWNIAAGQTLEIPGASHGQTIDFQGTTGLLVLDQPGLAELTISGFTSGDHIDLAGVSPTATPVLAGGTLTIGTLHLGITGDYTGQVFALLAAADGDAELTVATPSTASGRQTLNLGSGDSNATASGYANRITGSGASDNVVTITSGLNNSVHLGDGNNVVTTGTNTASSSITLGDGRNQVNLGGTLQTVKLGNGANSVAMSGSNNAITAGNGANSVTGGTGNSSVTLGGGTDSVALGGWVNSVTVGDGNDVIDAGAGSATIHLGQGNDTVVLHGRNNTVTGGNGRDSVSGGGLADTVTLGNGDDTVVLGGALNVITLGDGHNTVTAGSGQDRVTVGGGANSITLAGSNNVVVGGNGDNTVTGTASIQDSITLGDGADTVHLDGDHNTIHLGNGADSVTLGGQGNTVIGGNGGVSVTGGGAGNNHVTLGTGDNTVQLSGWGNSVSIGGGTVDAGLGASTIQVAGGDVSLTLHGRADMVFLHNTAQASIADHSAGLKLGIDSGNVVATITGFGAGSGAVLDLAGAGFASVAQVLAALHSDGHGGTALALGGTGSVEFQNLVPTALHAGNFSMV